MHMYSRADVIYVVADSQVGSQVELQSRNKGAADDPEEAEAGVVTVHLL